VSHVNLGQFVAHQVELGTGARLVRRGTGPVPNQCDLGHNLIELADYNGANRLQRPSTDADGHSVWGQAAFASGAHCAQSGSQEPNAAEDVGLVVHGIGSIKNAVLADDRGSRPFSEFPACRTGHLP